ncbi:MAG: hypothetical protein ACI9AV_000953 [Sediminicola sp.]
MEAFSLLIPQQIINIGITIELKENIVLNHTVERVENVIANELKIMKPI